MNVRRECCNYCMWYGPVNQDGTMRKHRPATSENKWGRKVQNRHEDYCQGSHKPFSTFGCDTVPDPNPLYQENNAVTETTATLCPAHHVADERGTHAEALPVPRCEPGTTYGVWDELAGGFTFAVDCAMDAANWAAEQLDEDPDGEMTIKAICREHEEQPKDGCEECLADDEPEDDEDELNADSEESKKDPDPSLDDYAKASRIIQSLIPGVRR